MSDMPQRPEDEQEDPPLVAPEVVRENLEPDQPEFPVAFDEQIDPDWHGFPSEIPPQERLQPYQAPSPTPPERIPHLGHVAILTLLALVGLFCASLLARVGIYFHLFGAETVEQAGNEIHYTLGSEGIFYFLTFAGCVLVFPLLWHRGLMDGLQWHGVTAWQRRTYLLSAAGACFVLAIVNGLLLPGPPDAPIDKMFRLPGAAWMLFLFGVTLAPFFEELAFRGFLLPALCTACDWTDETVSGGTGPRVATLLSYPAMTVVAAVVISIPIGIAYAMQKKLPALLLLFLALGPALFLGLKAIRSPIADRYVRPIRENGEPHWSTKATIIASAFTSILFAFMHADQTGYSVGPFLLLVCVSIVLCWVRLGMRSLAASVLVHASYNFMLFSLMFLGTSGFRHLDKM